MLFKKQRQQLDINYIKTLKTILRKFALNCYVILQDSIATQQLLSIYLAFCSRSSFDKASNIIALNNQIARNNKTTLIYEQLSHKLQTLKQH